MTQAERLHRLNAWYEGVPEENRFAVLAWFMIAVGAVNMFLTFAIGFPFGLLILIAIVCVAIVRLPRLYGMLSDPHVDEAGISHGPMMNLGRIDWVTRLNLWYDGMTEQQRFFVLPAILIVAGFVNMVLTLNIGFPFGLLFLIALLVTVAIRAPYTAGWIEHPPGLQIATPSLAAPAAPAPMITQAPAEPVLSPELAPEAAEPVHEAALPPHEAGTRAHEAVPPAHDVPEHPHEAVTPAHEAAAPPHED